MASLLLEPDQLQSTLQTATETRKFYFAEHPITFAQFLKLTGEDDDVELINGVIVEKMAVQLDHEWLFTWMLTVLNGFATKRGLGIVLGSRTAVEINEFDGRLPDLLFVREERRSIVQQKAIYGAPDLVIELVSPNDRPVDLRGLESNYRTIGVAEIVFVDRQRQTIRFVRKRETGYEEQIVTAGPVTFETMDGVTLQAEWILQEPRPDPIDTVLSLLQSG
jgi:Uma2 family endonuclease